MLKLTRMVRDYAGLPFDRRGERLIKVRHVMNRIFRAFRKGRMSRTPVRMIRSFMQGFRLPPQNPALRAGL